MLDFLDDLCAFVCVGGFMTFIGSIWFCGLAGGLLQCCGSIWVSVENREVVSQMDGLYSEFKQACAEEGADEDTLREYYLPMRDELVPALTLPAEDFVRVSGHSYDLVQGNWSCSRRRVVIDDWDPGDPMLYH